jgi:hypothetical protein
VLSLSCHTRATRFVSGLSGWIERAIEQRPRQFLRSRVMDMDGLAVVNVLLGEPEAAGKATTAALAMAGTVPPAGSMTAYGAPPSSPRRHSRTHRLSLS